MELNQAQRLFKAFRATGLCPYVAEQAVRNYEKQWGYVRERHIAYPALDVCFVWGGSPQGWEFWAKYSAAQVMPA